MAWLKNPCTMMKVYYMEIPQLIEQSMNLSSSSGFDYPTMLLILAFYIIIIGSYCSSLCCHLH
jgi:hypothetical protein